MGRSTIYTLPRDVRVRIVKTVEKMQSLDGFYVSDLLKGSKIVVSGVFHNVEAEPDWTKQRVPCGEIHLTPLMRQFIAGLCAIASQVPYIQPSKNLFTPHTLATLINVRESIADSYLKILKDCGFVACSYTGEVFNIDACLALPGMATGGCLYERITRWPTQKEVEDWKLPDDIVCTMRAEAETGEFNREVATLKRVIQ